MSRKKIKKQKMQKNSKALKQIKKDQYLLNLIQDGLELEEIMEKTGMDIMDITKAMAGIYAEYKDKI